MSAHVENKDLLGLTVRATLGNLLDARSILDRVNYVGRRNVPVSVLEERRRKIGPIFSLAIAGSF